MKQLNGLPTMNKLHSSHDSIQSMGEAYELLLEKALQKAHQSGAIVHDVIDVVRGDIAGLNKLSGDELIKLEAYLKRDMIDAAQYLNQTGKELKDWLGFDAALIKQKLWERFSNAADQTTVALDRLKLQAADVGYRTGEITGLGTLVCDQCGNKLHFHKPGHIPPCPQCNTTHFHRKSFETEKIY
ncbi:MAG: zinc ribbon-containing protein [Georgfuchsia sp.]